MTKNEARLEVAYDILQKIFNDLCNDHKSAQAERLFDIMRQLIMFSQVNGETL